MNNSWHFWKEHLTISKKTKFESSFVKSQNFIDVGMKTSKSWPSP